MFICEVIMKIKKAVILAGGYGTRMLPATKTVFKELLPIINIPAIQFAINECVLSGINEICIVLGENKYSIINYLECNTLLKTLMDNKNLPIEYYKIAQINTQANFTYFLQGQNRGTAQAIYKCKSFTGDEPFCVLFPDEIIFSEKPVIQQLISAYYRTSRTILGCSEISINDCNKYGMIKYNKNNGNFYEIDKIIEKPQNSTPSLLATCGRFIFEQNIYEYIKDLNKVNNEYRLPDAINKLAKNSTVYAYKFDGERFDIGNKMDYAKTIIKYTLNDKEISDSIKKYIMEIIHTENNF